TDRFDLARAGLVAAAVGWLVVAVAVLPLAGQGLLGLEAGVTTPVIWALVLVVYWLVWELAWGSPGGGAPVDPDRRRLVTLAPLAIGAGSLALLGVLKVPDWVRVIVAPPESGLTGPVPELTPVDHFYRVTKNFQDPVVPASGWSLRVGGLVGRPLKLSYQDLQRVPATTQIVTLECISNDVGGDLMSTGRFTGVPLRDLVTMAEPRPGAAAVDFRARDGYTESLPLSVVMGSPEIMVAHQLDGSPLPDGHGFPARMVIPGRYGMKGPKWLEQIDVAASAAGGFWEQQGWDEQAVVRTTSRFDTPQNGSLLRSGAVQLAGVAFAGTRGVQAVEWSADGGRTWTPADLRPPVSRLTWVLWTATWTPPGEGVHTLVVRARDGGGDLQTGQEASSYPSGATGYHSIQVTVGR
ncbi:MAG TPA: molybdopterin-dependent oxidoreductase, partial [Candidatus Eisenbacteria bacterium]|nr:molybdopterin-dependent oxidoreductase [Candidatus Eisenbacteria bacterium]